MHRFAMSTRSVLSVLLIIVLTHTGHAPANNHAIPSNRIGFLVLAADRGFLGNEEIRDAFELFSNNRSAALAFITDERTQQTLTAGLDSLLEQCVKRIIVLPLFISAAESRYQLAHELLVREKDKYPLVFARPYGESYHAVEALASRFRALEKTSDQNLLIVGYGATDDDNQQAMRKDWARIVKQASQGFDFRSISTEIIPERKQDEESESYFEKIRQQLLKVLAPGKLVASNSSSQVIAFAYGPKHDSMMSLEAGLERLLPGHARLNSYQVQPQQLAIWLEHEANRNLPLTSNDTGAILFAHGADFHWNENLRTAVEPLMDRYKIEFAFSMADPVTIERALRKLEQRGAKAAVIVSAYATSNSFRQEIEYLMGMDIKNQEIQLETRKQSKHDHHHGKADKPLPRITTTLPAILTGGFESHPLFAQALLDRALALSKNPAKDTVIIVAHGARDDKRNQAWLKSLEKIANHMRHNGGDKFKAIQIATWREDWPDKRTPWIEKVRTMVMEASEADGKAIVIPARTTATGPEKRFLAGLEFELGSGFAPHPLFTQWVEEQILQGMKQHMEIMNH